MGSSIWGDARSAARDELRKRPMVPALERVECPLPLIDFDFGVRRRNYFKRFPIGFHVHYLDVRAVGSVEGLWAGRKIKIPSCFQRPGVGSRFSVHVCK